MVPDRSLADHIDQLGAEPVLAARETLELVIGPRLGIVLNEASCEETLSNLKQLCPRTLDLICLDGNHEANHLRNEIARIVPSLYLEFLVLHDVDAAWPRICAVFGEIPAFGPARVEADSRVGIARFRAQATPIVP